MKQAWTILMRAVRDILDNPIPALQISVLPILIATYVGQHWLERALAAQFGFLGFGGRMVWWMWALGFAGTFLPLLWMAVGWHRFVLMGERPWPIAPRLHPGSMLAYAGRSLLVLLMALLATLVAVLIAMLVLGILGMALLAFGIDLSSQSEQLSEIAGGFFGTYFFLWYSPSAVAAACGQRITLRQAARLGDAQTVPIFWLTLASYGIVWLLQSIVGLMEMNGAVLGGYVLISNWFMTLLNVGLLTALLAEAKWGATPQPLSAAAGSADSLG